MYETLQRGGSGAVFRAPPDPRRAVGAATVALNLNKVSGEGKTFPVRGWGPKMPWSIDEPTGLGPWTHALQVLRGAWGEGDVKRPARQGCPPPPRPACCSPLISASQETNVAAK